MKTVRFSGRYDHTLQAPDEANPNRPLQVAAYLPGVEYGDVAADVLKAARDKGVEIIDVPAKERQLEAPRA